MDLKKEIEERLNVPVEETEVDKNGVRKKALIVGCDAIRPIIYPEDLNVSKGQIEGFIAWLKQYLEEIPNRDVIHMDKFEDVKDKLRICVAKKIDDNVVSRSVLDMYEYARVVLDDYSAKITTELFKLWNISEDELFNIARDNTKYTTQSIHGVLGIDDEGCEMLVISTEDLHYGAGAILNTEILDNILDRYDDEALVIIPSSIHEILTIPKREYDDSIKELVSLVNSTMVNPEDRLSDNVYEYSRSRKQVSIM